jgi:hypothetical protein
VGGKELRRKKQQNEGANEIGKMNAHDALICIRGQYSVFLDGRVLYDAQRLSAIARSSPSRVMISPRKAIYTPNVVVSDAI